VLSILVLALWGCTVDDLDISGKPCPCDDGFSCVNDRCVASTCSEQPGEFSVDNLVGSWSTLNTIAWDWETPGETLGTDLAGYVLVVGQEERAVRDCACKVGAGNPCDETGVRVIDAEENFELGHFTLSRDTGGVDQVLRTISYDHEPDTEYVAILVALDTAGGSRSTNLARRRTSRIATDEIYLAASAPLGDGEYAQPCCIEGVDHGDGTYSIDYTIYCEPVTGFIGSWDHTACPVSAASECPDHSMDPGGEREPDCFVNYRLQGLRADLSPIRESQFAESFLEFGVELSGGKSSGYSEIFIVVDDDPGDAFDGNSWWMRLVPIRIQARTYQIPLHQLVLSADSIRKMVWTDLNAHLLQTFRLGGIFSNGETLSVSNVKIRH
jgi:hypothetical protein